MPKLPFGIKKYIHFTATNFNIHTHPSNSCPHYSLSTLAQYPVNKPNAYSLLHLIRSSTKSGSYLYGQHLHCYAIQSGLHSNILISTAILILYVKFDSLYNAHQVFGEIPHPSVVTWNSLISGYVKYGQFRKGLGLFLELERSDIWSDSFSFTPVLTASGQLNLLQMGKSIHSKIVKIGGICDVVVCNCLIDMYGKCGSVEDSVMVFNEMNENEIEKDTFSWNSVIAACGRNKRVDDAFKFLYRMPNPDTISYNEIINSIAQFGNIQDAVEILCNMSNPNSSSWNSILTGYVDRGFVREALEFFSKMHSFDVEMDQFTFSSLLSGIGGISALTWGTLIHCCTIKCCLDESVVVGSALIDMYMKCGQVTKAELMFQSLPNKNLVTWNAMLSGYGHNGDSAKVIRLFEELKMVKDLELNGVTFLNVLSACWHNQMPLEVATGYFESMVKDFGIKPTGEHCSSIIKVMGQEGEVWRAEKMINELGFESCGMVWRALLGACGVCGDIDVGETAAAKLIEVEGDSEFVYVMMSNIYANSGKWGDVSTVRKLMNKRKVRKEVGYSWIEVDNVIPLSQ